MKAVDAQGLCRFPERRHAEGHSARRPRRLQLDRACSSATPPAGMGTDQGKLGNINASGILAEATGRAIADESAPRPSGRSTRRCRSARCRRLSRPPFPAGAQDAAARLGARSMGAVFVETGLWLRSAWFPLAGERLARRRHPRGQGGARSGRHLRCLDARQDRRAGAGCRRLPQPALLQRLVDARSRQGALWPDAARGRHRLRRRHDVAPRRRIIIS